MLRIFATLALVSIILLAKAQVIDLKFGKVVYADLEMKSFPADTSAGAVILNEVGQAQITEDGDLIFERYYKMKIFRKTEIRRGDIVVPLYKGNGQGELLLSVTASTYNLEGASMRVSKFDPHALITEKRSENLDLKKIALSDVREGSVIEVLIKTSSPYNFNFQPWEFQTDIPKIHSEYTTVIPGNYLYNITLLGFLKLTKQESTIMPDCFRVNGAVSECAKGFYSMDNIPAFKEEEYMTSKNNFLSGIHFELSELKQTNGLLNKYTLEWKDAEDQFRQEDRFGKYLKKSRSLWADKAKELAGNNTDELAKAKAVYDFFKSTYTWDEESRLFAAQGAKEVFDSHKGNSAEINLALVGALQSLDLKAYPVILSTRDHGAPIEIHPVISSFNDVIASVEIGGKTYLLDALNSLRPFGMLPARCLNGKGRLMTDPSVWVDLKPADKQKTTSAIDLTLENEFFTGKIVRSRFGYDAVAQRGEILEAGDAAAYAKKLQKEWDGIEIVNYDVENLSEIEKPLVEKFEVKIPVDKTGGSNTVFLNPFIIDRMESNPFKSTERLYPVDYGAPIEKVFLISVTYPADLVIDELPKSAALALPQAGGRYLFSATPVGNKLSITSMLTLNKPIYTANEYHSLRELYSRMIQVQDAQIVLKKKP